MYTRFAFDEVVAKRNGAEFLFCADREPIAKGGVLYEPYPIAEDRSWLLLLGAIDMDTDELTLSIVGDGAYQGVFSYESGSLKDARWQLLHDGLRIHAMANVPPGRVVERLGDRPEFVPSDVHVELEIQLVLEPEKFPRLLRKVRDGFARTNSDVPAVRKLVAKSMRWLSEAE